MASLDDYRKVARRIKSALDSKHLAFKTFNRAEFIKELKLIAGTSAHAEGKDTWSKLELAFMNEGLLAFPPPEDTEVDGFVRIYRSGSLMATIVNAVRFPGEGSDTELIMLLEKLKADKSK